jgi:hypothetical protein
MRARSAGLRASLGDAHHGEVREHEAHRLVELGGPPLAPRRHRAGHRSGLAPQRARLLDAEPGLVGIADHLALGPQRSALVERPLEAAALGERGGELGLEAEQVLDVRGGVGALIVVQRAAQPIGEAVALGEVHVVVLLDQGGQRRERVPAEPGRQLGVEQVSRQHPAGPVQHLEVLARGVHHHGGRTLEGPGERGEIDRERIDEGLLVVPRQLHQGELGEVGLLAVELGVDTERRHLHQLLDDLDQLVVPIDPPRWRAGRLDRVAGLWRHAQEPASSPVTTR